MDKYILSLAFPSWENTANDLNLSSIKNGLRAHTVTGSLSGGKDDLFLDGPVAATLLCAALSVEFVANHLNHI